MSETRKACIGYVVSITTVIMALLALANHIYMATLLALIVGFMWRCIYEFDNLPAVGMES